jgi:hypothetical protein
MTRPITSRASRICPKCLRRCGAHLCRWCGYASDASIPTVGEILDGADTGIRWCDVDLGRLVRWAYALGRASR